MGFGWGGWPPYVSVAERRRKADQQKAKLRKGGVDLAPVVVEGRTMARTFWGTAWCRNLESYSDYESRLPRGRSYVRNGLVVHLDIAAGGVKALVSGTSLYTVAVNISPVPKARWRAICKESAGAIDSLVELLQGRFSKAVMDHLCRQNSGLFPSPREITFSCTCPDWAYMCKHVAAVLYGIGVRLDEQPELLFRLRDVSELDLIAKAGEGLRLSARAPSKDRALGNADLSALFGLELAAVEPEDRSASAKPKVAPARGRKTATPGPKKKPAAPRAGARKAVAKKTGSRTRKTPTARAKRARGGRSPNR